MNKSLFILFSSMFVIMVGYGITLPVLTFYIERMALSEGATDGQASFHVGALTGIFALMQFFFAPVWGKLSDRIGRRPIFLFGLSGYFVFMIFFGMATNLIMLYGARILGGILSSAVLPTANVYVADMTSEENRGRGIALLGSAISLGVVAGPALGAFLSGSDWHVDFRFGHFSINEFSIPFFIASLLSLFSLLSAIIFLPDSLKVLKEEPNKKQSYPDVALNLQDNHWWSKGWLTDILILSFISWLALALFEGTFALHAQRVLNYGPTQMGFVFVICGLVMGVAQAGVVGPLINRVGERHLVVIGLVLIGAGLALLMSTKQSTLILLYVGVFALGVALVNPSLVSLVTKNADSRLGIATGLQASASYLGLATGPLLGGLLFAWHIHMPYLITAMILIVAAIYAKAKIKIL